MLPWWFDHVYTAVSVLAFIESNNKPGAVEWRDIARQRCAAIEDRALQSRYVALIDGGLSHKLAEELTIAAG